MLYIRWVQSAATSTNNQLDKYRGFEKLLRLRPNDWPKFQGQLKKLHLTEI